MPSRDPAPTPVSARGSRVASHSNNVAPLAGRKRVATGDTSEASKRHEAKRRVRAQDTTHRDPSELYYLSRDHFQSLSIEQRKALYDVWLPQEPKNTIFMLEKSDQQPTDTLSYEAIVHSASMVSYMLPIDEDGKQRDPHFEHALANFYKRNHFEVDLSLLHKFRTSFAGFDGLDGAADRHVRAITVCVPIYPWNETRQAFDKFDWTWPRADEPVRYLKTLTWSLSQLNHFKLPKTVVIKFKGPGVADGSDIQFQAFITELAAWIMDPNDPLKIRYRFLREHTSCARCARGSRPCEDLDLSDWFEVPTEEAIKNYERGAATLKEAMQIRLAGMI